MMRVGNVTLERGAANICVSLMEDTHTGLQEEIRQLPLAKIDLLEWRVDQFSEIMNRDEVVETLQMLRQEAQDIPLIFTYRDQGENEGIFVDETSYFSLNAAVLQTGLIDFIDIEQSYDANRTSELVAQAHAAGIYVILSHHDFTSTPEEKEMCAYVKAAIDLGADVAKLAVTATKPEDILALWGVTQSLSHLNQIPLITMAMGNLGRFSRLGGHLFGSCVTFASGKRPSASGQLSVEDVYAIQRLISSK